MKITAKQFNDAPQKAYRSADKGEVVIITNARYPDVEFLLIVKAKKEVNNKVKK